MLIFFLTNLEMNKNHIIRDKFNTLSVKILIYLIMLKYLNILLISFMFSATKILTLILVYNMRF